MNNWNSCAALFRVTMADIDVRNVGHQIFGVLARIPGIRHEATTTIAAPISTLQFLVAIQW